MQKSIVTTGKTIDLAIAAALEQLGLDRDSVSVQVLENARTGFLGIGASPAKVEVSYEVPDEIVAPPTPAPALTAASRKPKKQAPKLEKPLEMPVEKPAEKPQPAAEAPKKETPAPKKPAAPKKQESPQKAVQAPRQPDKKVYAPAEPGSVEETVEVFLKGLLERMGSDAVPHAFRKDSETIGVELTGEDLGILIGRRGETLDAIQHLANYTINKDSGSKRTRISIDAENYRGKREEALQHLANKMAAKAVRYKRNMTLEPMNAYERHVIHAALQSHPDVTTYSTGTEPNRRIIVAYQKEK